MIAAAVALGFFAAAVLVVVAVQRGVERSRSQAAFWAVMERRLRPAAAATGTIVALGVTFAEAAKAAADFAAAWRRVDEVFARSDDAVAALRDEVSP